MPRKRLSAATKASRKKERNRRREDAKKADISTVTSAPVLTTSSLEYVQQYLTLMSKQQWHRLSLSKQNFAETRFNRSSLQNE